MGLFVFMSNNEKVATEIAPEETVQEVVPQEESAPEEVESTQPEEAAAEEEAAAPEEKEEEAAPETKEDDVDDEDDDEEEDEEDVPRKQSGKELIEDLREHLNIIFIGHVDAGKSTIAGNVLYLTGMVDDRTIQKYEREAKDKKHGSWFLAFVMDTNEEERAKGKTVEVGRAHFSSPKKRYTILDAPGHKNYVPNMIGGAAQADVGVLVISARQGEFESGFEGQGQTREHTTLAKTLGVKQLVIVVNKMDEQSVLWSEARYAEIQKKFTPFLKSVGYNPKTDIHWIPVSGFTGANIKEPAGEVCTWYKGSTLLQLLDDLDPLSRDADGPIRLPVLDRYKEKGTTVVLGKLESGTLKVGDSVTMMPNKQTTEVTFLELDEAGEVDRCKAGEIVTVGLKDINTSDISQGFVLCGQAAELPVVNEFEAQLAIIDLLPNKPIVSAGYDAIIHIHTCTEEVTIEELLSVMNKKTRKTSKRKPTFVRKGDIVTVRIVVKDQRTICCELFEKIQQLGRFTLRDEGKTIAIGKITKMSSPSE